MFPLAILVQESAGFGGAKALASGVNFCRDLVNSPANVLTPTSLADAAKMMAEEHGLECEILEVTGGEERGKHGCNVDASRTANTSRFEAEKLVEPRCEILRLW